MKVLILYETQKGFTKECGEKILAQLEDADLRDIQRDKYDISEYDVIVVGAPIYEGRIDKYTERFFKDNKWKLLNKKLGIFCAGMNTKEFNMAMQESLPGDIFLHAEIIHCGGRIQYDALSKKEKRVVKKRLGITQSDSLEYPHKIDAFIKWIKQA